MTTTTQAIAAWVDAASTMQGLTLDAPRREAVIEVFSLLADMAARIESVPLPTESEPAPVYRP